MNVRRQREQAEAEAETEAPSPSPPPDSAADSSDDAQMRNGADAQIRAQVSTQARPPASEQAREEASTGALAEASKEVSERARTRGREQIEDIATAVRDALRLRRIHAGGTKASVDMTPELSVRLKRYCLDHGDVSGRQVMLELLIAFLEAEGY